MRYPALFPASDLVNHWAASADSLWLTPTSFSLITVGGRPLCLFIHPTTIENAVEFYSSFDINSILELCCWGTAFLQPSWPLSAWGYKWCVQHTSAGLHSWRTFAPVPSCLQSPRREPDQTQREASARSRARISQNPIRKPDNVKNWWGIEIKKKKHLTWTSFTRLFRRSDSSDGLESFSRRIIFNSAVILFQLVSW